jgi:hypothetical protein
VTYDEYVAAALAVEDIRWARIVDLAEAVRVGRGGLPTIEFLKAQGYEDPVAVSDDLVLSRMMSAAMGR